MQKVSVENYSVEKSCEYKSENYSARDNGAVLRHCRSEKKSRRLDDIWTFGDVDSKTGYMKFSTERVHRIVATAFHGVPESSEFIVDHIDTNRQNNRVENLRWITKFENAVLNPASRKKIEFVSGVDIVTFLSQPSKYRENFSTPDFSWMRTVSEIEGKACLARMQEWANEDKKSSDGGRLGDWVFKESNVKIERSKVESDYFDDDITISLTLGAVQRKWRTPSEFPFCPREINSTSIKSYANNLKEGCVFSKNTYGESLVVKFALANQNTELIVMTGGGSSVKSFALAKVTLENGVYVHASLGSYFTPDGAEKQYVLAQGLEWTGGDTFDDFC